MPVAHSVGHDRQTPPPPRKDNAMLTAAELNDFANEVAKTAIGRAKLAGIRCASNKTRAEANIIAAGLTVKEGDAFLAAYYRELRRLNP